MCSEMPRRNSINVKYQTMSSLIAWYTGGPKNPMPLHLITCICKMLNQFAWFLQTSTPLHPKRINSIFVNFIIQKTQPDKRQLAFPSLTRRPCCRRELPLDAGHLYRTLSPNLRATQWIETSLKLEYGPTPNVLAALPNTGGALCSSPQSLADAYY